MRHRKIGKRLGRNSSHRKAMFRNMSVAIINREMIRTTLQKAKELRRFLEPLVTLAKEDSVFNRRMAFSKLRSKEAVGKLFQDLGPKHFERQGGYIQILKHGFRAGDTANMAIVKFCE